MVGTLYFLAFIEGLAGVGFLIAAFMTKVPILAIAYGQIGAASLVGAIFVAGFGRMIELLELILSSQERSAKTFSSSTPKPSRSSAPTKATADEEFELRWAAWAKYQPAMQSALAELEQFGASATEELKKACRDLRDLSILPSVVKVIRSEEEAKNKAVKDEQERRTALRVNAGSAFEEFNVMIDENKENLGYYIRHSKEFEEFIRKIGFRIEDNLKWMDIIEISSGDKVKTFFQDRDIIEFISQHLSE